MEGAGVARATPQRACLLQRTLYRWSDRACGAPAPPEEHSSYKCGDWEDQERQRKDPDQASECEWHSRPCAYPQILGTAERAIVPSQLPGGEKTRL